MFPILYAITGLAFVVGVILYTVFCMKLSEDIKQGRIVVEVEPTKA